MRIKKMALAALFAGMISAPAFADGNGSSNSSGSEGSTSSETTTTTTSMSSNSEPDTLMERVMALFGISPKSKGCKNSGGTGCGGGIIMN